MVVETRAPRHAYRLLAGERCAVPPKTAHYVHGEADGVPDRCRVSECTTSWRWAGELVALFLACAEQAIECPIIKSPPVVDRFRVSH
jgi:hypothetical protein